jgi:hypothetical protein
MITLSRLLKSWATLPANCPSASIPQEFEKARKLGAHLTAKTAQLLVVCCWL